MIISRETYKKIDPNSASDRAKYAKAVIDEVSGVKREFTPDPVFGGWHDRNLRPVVHFGWGLAGYSKRLRLEPFCD